MSERDPRKDPKIGDVVVNTGLTLTVTLVDRSVHYRLTQPGHGLYAIPVDCRVSKRQWREQLEDAKVIHRA